MLLLFVGVAFGNNVDVFLATADRIVGLVVLQNLLALGLAILFTFFPDESGMILIAAFWGVWHLVSGLVLAGIWSRQTARGEAGARQTEGESS